MKKSRIFLATGGLLLAISAVFATKANKKFTTVATAGNLSGTNEFVVKGTSNVFTTTGNVAYNVWAKLVTSINKTTLAGPIQLYTVVASGSSHKPVQFR